MTKHLLALRTYATQWAGFALLALSGCQPVSAPTEQQGLVYCSQGTPSSLNPQLTTSATVVEASSHQLYNRLLSISDDGLELIPELASSWHRSDDGTLYTFELRQGVQFHQTSYFTPSRPLTAEDVVFSFERIINKKHPYHAVGGSDYSFFNSVGFPLLVKSVKALSLTQVQFELIVPDSTFLVNLATNFSVILSAEYGQQLLENNHPELIDKLPIGTGPYKFYRYKTDSYIKFKRHEAYWQEKPTLSDVVYDITPNSTIRLAKLLTGECDVVTFPMASDIGLIRTKPQLKMHYQTGFNLGYWAFNTDKPPFDDVRVRQALAMAVDRVPIMEAVYYGTASPATGLLPPASWAYDGLLNGIPFNPDGARKLLAEAGYADGLELDIWVMPVQRPYNPNAKKMALLIQENLRTIGVQAHIVSYEWNVFRSKLAKGEHDTVLLGWTADNADPDNFFRPILSCQAKQAGTNRAMWCDPYYDQLIDLARQTPDNDKRLAHYRAAQTYLNETVPLLPIAHGMLMQTFHSNVHNLKAEPFGGIDFTAVEVE